MKLLRFVLLVLLPVLGFAADNAPAPKLHIVLVGDSTVNDRTGWGAGFRQFVNEGATVSNTAQGGRSSKSFIDEGHWAKALALKGDYYLIQFGHNDEPDKGPERETDPATTFTQNMARYVDEVRAIGGQPILITSLVRRNFDPANPGKLKPSLVPYADAVRKLAVAKNVPLLDLNARSHEFAERIGPTETAKLNPAKPDGTPDTTHLEGEGSVVIARLVIDELRKVVPALAPVLRTEPVAPTAEFRADIEYGRVGDERLLLDVNVPDGAGPFPVAILVHGGGWSRGDKRSVPPGDSADITPWFAPLTAAKFTWFSINYRLAPAHRWPEGFEDLQTAIRWVKAHAAEFKGDPSRIALFGHSSGGHVVCLAATLVDDSTRVQAVVGFAPVTNHEQELPIRGGLGTSLQDLLNRPKELTPESVGLLRELSPINHVRPGLPPFLLIHGEADKSVPIQQSYDFQAKLRANGMPCELIVIPGAPHALATWEKIAPDYPARMVAWLRQTLDHPMKPPAWQPDLGDELYQNPIIHADYSDPDVVRVGDDFWMTSSSFNHVPGLPVLHSKDLVNWTLISHALPRLVPEDVFRTPQHGKGVWAPAIRFYAGKYWIYYPDPDFGIYVVTADDPAGQWSAPVLVKAGKGLIDPCPLWDDDGKVWLIHGWAKSRAGINNIVSLQRLSDDGRQVTGEAKVIIDGAKLSGYNTLEGPKFYKRNGWYYIFAPAGGVATGWQSVFRAKNIEGPYEDRIVLDQGKSSVNGPHQGAWVDTPSGEEWFLHFQDQDAYGRVVHLQPVTWKNDWPMMGTAVATGADKGEPVLVHAKPALPRQPVAVPATSDEFDAPKLGLQWQWQANPGEGWHSLVAKPGSLRLFAQPEPKPGNLYDSPNLLLQKFPALEFTVTTRLDFTPKADGDSAGLIVFGYDYAWIGLKRAKGAVSLVLATRREAVKGEPQEEIAPLGTPALPHYVRVTVREGGKCRFSFSDDGKKFTGIGTGEFTATVGRWVGAKVGLFAAGSAGATADFEWFHVEPVVK